MIPHFSEAEWAVHYPDDRRAFVAVKPYVLQYLASFLCANPPFRKKGVHLPRAAPDAA